jgi:hypothetical protein
MILPEFLQVAQIFIAHGVPFVKCSALKFSGTDFSDIMGQFHAYSIF